MSWKPWLMRSHAVCGLAHRGVNGAVEHHAVPLIVVGAAVVLPDVEELMGALKKNSPTLSSDFE